jgi:hypothetical protein
MAKDKATKQAEKAEKQQLKSAQKAEVTALKSVGASKSEVKAEQKANSAELKSLLKAQKSGTYTPTTNLAGVLSGADTYANAAYAGRVQSLLGSAAQNYTDYNIATVNQRGNVTTGVGLDKLVDYELGKTGKKFDTLMDRAKTYVGNSYTAADLQAQGVNLKEDKKNPGLFKWSTGGDGNKEITYFTQNPDGTFTGAGINRVRTEAQDGGFFDSPLGKIALGIGGYFLGPAAGGLMGLGTGTLGGTVGGGLLGGVASKLGGGKFAAGVLPGAGGGFAGAGGFGGSLMGTQAAAPITTIDPLTGQVLSTSTAAASSLPSAAPSIFQQAIEGTQDFFKPATDAISRTINPNEFAFPGVERGVQTFTPVPGSLQAALPELGVATQATMAPYTAIPGSFAAAVPVLLNNYSSLGLLPSIGSAVSRLIPTSMPTLPGGNMFGNVGSNLISSLLQPQQTPEQVAAGGGFAGADANYDALIAALSAPRVQPRSLV